MRTAVCISMAGVLLASCSDVNERGVDSREPQATVADQSAGQDRDTAPVHALHAGESPAPESADDHHADHHAQHSTDFAAAESGHGHNHGAAANHEHSAPANHGDAPDRHAATPGADGSDAAAGVDDLAGLDAATIFSRRILPILNSEAASSCTECHLAGVELRDFILNDQSATFAALKANGMIDVENPEESKLLQLIGREPESPDPLLAKVREQELRAFRAWIVAAVREPELLAATAGVDVGTSLPLEVVRHARSDRVVSSFVDNIWSEIGRCINCHSPEQNRQMIGRNGRTEEDVDAISWISPHDPEGTLANLADGGNIDLRDPAQSLVLLKPAGLEEHGGGPKFFPGSETYRRFLSFLTDYTAIVSGQYQSVDDLPDPPRELALLSEQQLRVSEVPAAYAELAMQVDFYRWNEDTQDWSQDRWATAFSRVNGKQGVWQNPILITAPAGSDRADQFRQSGLLPPGTYLAKIYLDRDRKTEADPTFDLSTTESIGAVEVRGEWPPGYQPPRIIRFPADE